MSSRLARPGPTHSHRQQLLKQSRRRTHFQTHSAAAYGSRPSPGRREDERVRSRSRGMFSPEFCKFVGPLQTEGAGKAGCATAPAVSCAKNCAFGAHEHTGSAETSRPSPRNGFTAYFVLSPVSGLVVTVTCGIASTSLAPASRRQDHTTSPYAFVQSSAEPKRPSHSGPRIVTIAKRPSCGPGCANKCQ